MLFKYHTIEYANLKIRKMHSIVLFSRWPYTEGSQYKCCNAIMKQIGLIVSPLVSQWPEAHRVCVGFDDSLLIPR